MRAVTIESAKAHLGELVDAAQAGEEIVLMRGPKHVAAIVPITDAHLELALDLTDEQAARLWRQLATEQAAGRVAVFDSADQAVAHLGHKPHKASRKIGSRR
jgi:antitoxin (DNA-binding transcriptional repressor) of toxin-antitoxin stability system